MELYGLFQCAYCGQGNEICTDLSAGIFQSYVEDCQTCCRPNILSVAFHETDTGDWEVSISSELES
ncbi:MAG: CPXCG motif-containing cysteine-rich protein [Candidatus Latescibacteria bacterium]|nr:CPXCG motif-containing cysteine-rich protein [Candidatus Latescibacterota bacterium]